MDLPLISIIIAVYNGEKYLADTLKSVIAQGYDNYELIIVNDCSFDNTAEIISKFSSDSRIKVINNNENLGLTKSLNIAIGNAKGEYIARIDADDLWHKNHLSGLVNILKKNPEIVLLGSAHREFFDNDVSDLDLLTTPDCNVADVAYDDLIKKNIFCHSAVVFRRMVDRKLVSYREKFMYSQDYDLWLRLNFDGKIKKLDCVTCFYRRSFNAVSLQNTERQVYFSEQAKKLAVERKNSGTDHLEKRGCFPDPTDEEKKYIISKTCNIQLYFAVKLYGSGKLREALKLCLKAFSYSPFVALKEFISLVIWG